MQLFRVTCRGMTTSLKGGIVNGIAYVVANNSDEAYRRLKDYLDKKELGFSKEREMDKVELIAESGDYPDCGIRLFEASEKLEES